MTGLRAFSRLSRTLVLLLALTPRPGAGQDLETEPGIRLKPGLGFEYVSRTLVWDSGTYTSKMTSVWGVFRLDAEIQKGFTLGALAGYSLSNFNGLVFRQLPFSADYEAGNAGGFLLGLDVEKMIFTAGDFEIGAGGRYVIYLGGSQELPVPGLNQSGTVNGKGTWMRIQVGPMLRYNGYQDFTPFLAISYDALWGTYTMAETIQSLSGTEDKKITGKGALSGTIGILYDPTPAINLRAALNFLPYTRLGVGGLGLDLGGSLTATISF